MAKKPTKAAYETDDTDYRISSSEEKQTTSSESPNAGISPESESDEPQSLAASGIMGSTHYEPSQVRLETHQEAKSAPEWQTMNPPCYNTRVSQHQQGIPSVPFPPGSFLDTRGITNEMPGLGAGFVPRSTLTESDPTIALAAGQIIRAQWSMQPGVGLAHSSIAASSQSSSSDPQEMHQQQLQQHLQQYQQPQVPLIDPRFLASVYLQPQGSTFPGAPAVDYQTTLFQAASSPFFRDFPRNEANVPTGYLGASSTAAVGLPTFQWTPANVNAPSSSQYASLRGGSSGQKAEVSVPYEERGKRPLGTHPAMTGVARGVLEPFPERLHRLLSEVEAAGLSDVISFTEDGTAFRIHKPEDFFRKVVQVYFKQTRLSSFKRQLNLYGFELIDHGRSKGAYYHSLFLRNRPDLARQIRRVDNKTASRDKMRRSAPDFYNMPPVLSSAEAEQKRVASKSCGEETKMETETDSTNSHSSKNGSEKKRSSDEEGQDP